MMPGLSSSYTGRFAPSPSGPLHFGSLIAATGSYLQARSQQGKWLLRIEDIDTPRMQPGAADDIMRTLEQFHLHWDGEVWYQSRRLERYQQIFQMLQQQQQAYGCQCSRKQIAENGGIYTGHCSRLNLQRGKLAWRLRCPPTASTFTDLVFGQQQISPQMANEDYILRRSDGLFAYQLVVVIDDLDQQVTEVIRGADLLETTPRQQALFRLLQGTPPGYGHLPLAVTRPGFKLSKQNHAAAISSKNAGPTLCQVLAFLGHPPPASLQQAPPAELLAWAIRHWDLAKVPGQMEILQPG
ncbi:tRNA glutamyl-Q(34) synthetase GluQRS [Chromatiaceae bacterium AAb-1]|nr:tRNA glutamyl-Q(34) synthetase GluQRS [Chromatiaceae bacterium AAb-1]